MPRLLIVGEDGSERTVDVTERTIQIGRGPGNDIILGDPGSGVSRSHAELRFRNGRCVVVDLQSQNGTWLDGERVEDAEVPVGAEIGIGSFKLRLLSVDRVASVVPDDEAKTELQNVRLAETASVVHASQSRRDSGTPAGLLFAGGVIVVAAAALAWALSATSNHGIEPTEADGPRTTIAEAPKINPLPASQPASTIVPPVAPAASSPPPTKTAASRPPASARPTGNLGITPQKDAPLIGRKPGESVEGWRMRTAAFQTRYAYSRAALDRGDFTAAAGGFEAILREEPGFLDVPQLLLRARDGLRDVARDVFEAGKRLDAAGDWLGALQKYEQAGQIHAEVTGLADAVKSVREKLRIAGDNAFEAARKFDAAGQTSDALKEYEKAVQWLPANDPKRIEAQARVDQLKRAGS